MLIIVDKGQCINYIRNIDSMDFQVKWSERLQKFLNQNGEMSPQKVFIYKFVTQEITISSCQCEKSNGVID